MGNATSAEGVCCGVRPANKTVTTDPAFLAPHTGNVPKVLDRFLEARRIGDVDGAAACCTDDMTMKGPMGEFAGLEIVRTKAFSKQSQPMGKILMLLQYQPQLSTPTEAVYAREYEAQIGYAQVPLRQEVCAARARHSSPGRRTLAHRAAGERSCRRQFTVLNPGTESERVCLVVFSKLQP